ncbi:autotransporter domain-containing protein [Noviherbaspirillum cavernae]|nr:autotransporter domain-containing protein [Noviherbaspirillum cavernae]
MNKSYRIVWSKARSGYIVTHEKAASRGKPSSTCKSAIAAVAVLALHAVPALAANVCGPGANTINTVQTADDDCTLSGGSLTVTNAGSIMVPTANTPAVKVSGAIGDIINNGTISSGANLVGISLQNGTTLSGSIINRGTLSSVSNGTFLGNGAISAVGTTIAGSLDNDGGTITNTVYLKNSSVGSVRNINGGQILPTGTRAIGISLVDSTVTGGVLNDATSSITSSQGWGMQIYNTPLGPDGFVNRGSITGFDSGVIIGATTMSSNIDNYGTIAVSGTTGPGMSLSNNTLNGRLTNATGAGITGAGYGIAMTGNKLLGGLVNQGTISGAHALSMSTKSQLAGGLDNSGTIKSGTASHMIGIVMDDSSIAGGIKNSGTIEGVQFGLSLKNNAELGADASGVALDNSGTITSGASSYAAAAGINLDTGAKVIGDIVNSGTISGWFAISINSSQVTGKIINSGTINGSRFGIAVSGSSVSGIYVSGSSARILGGVLASNTGFFVSSGAVFANENAYNVKGFTVENGGRFILGAGGTTSGMINGITVGSDGFKNDGTVVVNAGVTADAIHGNVVQNGSFLIGADGGAAAKLRVDGTFSNTSTVELHNATLDIGGALTNSDKIALGKDSSLKTGALFTNSGTLAMGNGSSVVATGGVSNSGKVTLGAGTSATLQGSYTQTASGVLQVGVNDDTTYAKLAVNGTADLGSNAKIDVDVTQKGHVFNVKRLENVITATTLDSDGTFKVTDNSELFNFGAVKEGNAVHLTLKSAADTGGGEPGGGSSGGPGGGGGTPPAGPTVLGSVKDTGNHPGVGAATVLDQLIAANPSGAIPSMFVGLTNRQEVSQAVTQTLPLLNGGSMAAATGSIAGINRVVQARIEANRGLSSGDEFLGDKYVWFKPFGSWARQDDQDGIAGFKASTKGFVLGLDGTTNGRVRLGAGLAYASSNVNGNSSVAPQRMDVDVFQLLGYGSVSLDERTELNFQADVGQNNNKGSRTIAFTSSTASADYKSLTAHAGLGLGRVLPLNEVTNFTPSARLDYTWIRDQSYAENGAGVLNLNVNGRSARALTLGIDGKLTHNLDTKTTLTANLGAGYDLLNEKAAIVAAYAGAPSAAFATYGMDKTPWSVRGGLGVARKTDSGVELTLRYDAEGRTGFLNQTASVKARWAF